MELYVDNCPVSVIIYMPRPTAFTFLHLEGAAIKGVCQHVKVTN
jgi:hypothetical protein